MLNAITFNTPQKWRRSQRGDTALDAGVFDILGDNIQVESLLSAGDETYEDLAKDVPSGAKALAVKVTRQPDRTVNGVTGYYFTGSGPGATYYASFGTVSQGHDITIQLICSATGSDLTKTKADFESVLASIQWTQPPAGQ